MNTTTVSSVDNLTEVLSGATAPCVCIERRASDDIAPALVAHAELLAAQGTPALIICADATAQEQFRRHVSSRSTIAENIVSIRDLCLSILSDPQVEQEIGRRARVLSENEHDVLMEDMKASGLKPRRLREMLKFFYKSISDCAHEEPDWLITSEEQMVFAVLEENLSFRKAVLACELPSLALRGLSIQGARKQSRTVIVDDFGSLSLASQRLVEQLAGDRLIIAGTPLPALNGEEAYPNHEGFTSFIENHPEALSLTLEINAPEATATYATYDDSAAELEAVPSVVAALLDAGLQPSDILVAVPNDTWASSIKGELDCRGVKALKLASSDKIKGDPRKPGRFADLKLATFLKLYNNPDDIVSLRSWVGFGDWLMCSDSLLELMAYASERHLDAPQAIAALRALPDDERPVTFFKKLDQPLDELEALMRACTTISKQDTIALFEAHGMPLRPAHIDLLGTDEARADIANLSSKAFASQQNDPSALDAVLIAPYKRCHSRHVHTVIFTGLVNGFLPSIDAVDDKYTIDHRTLAREREKTLFEDVRATATNALVCSLFAVDRLEKAALLKVQTSRIFIKDGVQYAKICPSEFIPATK